MMMAMLDGARVEAARGLEHHKDYQCPVCTKSVILHARIGGWVIPHFKHKAHSNCSHGRGETEAHRSIKRLLRDHYSAKGYDVELEFTTANRRADVFLKEIKAAFEVEFSPKETGDFLRKCRDYEKAGIRSLWILKQQVNYVNIEPGDKVRITTSPVLRAWLCNNVKGARIAFFSHMQRTPVVVRGALLPCMLYMEAFGDYQGGEYPSRRYMVLYVEKIIKQTTDLPRFPSGASARPHAMEEAKDAA